MNLNDLRNELKAWYEKRYGPGSVLEIREQRIHNWMHQFIIFYVDDDGAVKANHDCYAYTKDGKNWYWYNRKPRPPAKPVTTTTFRDKLQKAIKNAISSGKIEYAEILSLNEDIKKARVFIKDDTTEGTYIVSLDANGNITKVPTNFK